MTEQENKAIRWMQNVRDDAVVTLDHIAKEEPNVSPMLYAGRKEKAETIIKGFEELEQYRAIGTVEECRAAVDKQMEIRNKAIDDFMNIVEEKADGGYFDVGGYHDVTNDIVGILDKIAEQLKGSVGNEVN